MSIPPHGEARFTFQVRVGDPGRRQRLAADITLDDRPLGQLADAVADVAPA
jgi:hypothetical protein